jgi:hypothetical protein
LGFTRCNKSEATRTRTGKSRPQVENKACILGLCGIGAERGLRFYDNGLYKTRGRIEIMFGRLKGWPALLCATTVTPTRSSRRYVLRLPSSSGSEYGDPNELVAQVHTRIPVILSGAVSAFKFSSIRPTRRNHYQHCFRSGSKRPVC